MAILRRRRRVVAAMTLTVLMTLLVSMDCHAVVPRDAGLHATAAETLTVSVHPDIPCCPLDGHDHSDADHCVSCLHCSCNAFMAWALPTLSYAPTISPLNSVSRFNHLPDVHLPIFIPPQNLA